VLEAAPDACVWLGTAEGVSGAELMQRLARGADDDAVKAALRRLPLRAGDTVLVEAGTVHAIGPGLVLYEIQQSSDATYRLHDWGRGREVHRDKAADAILDHPPVVVRRAPEDAPGTWHDLVDEPAFRLARGTTGAAGRALSIAPRHGWALLTILAGTGTLTADDREVTLPAGSTTLVMDAATLAGPDVVALLAEPGA
jgi:mannose-6-phosphate isomerase